MYNWIDTHVGFSEENKKSIYRNMACANNLEMVKLLEECFDPLCLPPKYFDDRSDFGARTRRTLAFDDRSDFGARTRRTLAFDELIENNAYKVVSWLLEKFKYDIPEFALAENIDQVSNYSERLVLAYQK
jgi:hypothetical protein